MPLPAGLESGVEPLLSEAAEEPEESESGQFDILDVLEAMSAHFHEHHADIMRWTWKLFCRKWVRLMAWAAQERERERQRETDRAFAELRGRG